jgi:FtsP/CotA-like multicopper oxidase with cupredoxin domain
MATTRRFTHRFRWLLWTGAVLLTGAVGVIGLVVYLWTTTVTNTAGRVDFIRELAIPPLARSHTDREGRRVFDLDLRPGTTDFSGRGRADTWGINGAYLGPTVRAARGEKILLNVTNGVGETTTIHWHGMHLPARMDGGPHQAISPGETWSPSWTVDQPAATLWYHPHLHDETAEHVYRGLAGMLILDDGTTERHDLPDRYGIDDIPVIVQDKTFTEDGDLDRSTRLFSPIGILGDTVVVNGTVAPYHEVTTEQVRLRLLNASNARVYNFGLDDDRAFSLIASDGGLLSTPQRKTRVRLSPGERAEIVVRMRAGESTVLRSRPTDLGTDWWNQRFAGGDDTLDILQLRAADRLAASAPLPAVLADVPRLGEDEADARRLFRLGETRINGDDMDMNRIDEVVTVGNTEVWTVTNDDGSPHSFHVHDVQFQILDIDNEPPPAELAGWKDTVYVEPGATLRLIMRFRDYADPGAPYMFHCHLLRHEDQGMMGQFVVVDGDQQAHDGHVRRGGAPEGISH